MTDTMVREVRGVLSLSHEKGNWRVPVLRTEAVTGAGIEELAQKIDEHRAFIEERGLLAERRARNLRSEVIGIAWAMKRDFRTSISTAASFLSINMPSTGYSILTEF